MRIYARAQSTIGINFMILIFDCSGMNSHLTTDCVHNGGSLTRMTVGSDTLTFGYDASGKPLFVQWNNSRYFYATNLQGDVVAIVSVNGIPVVEYTYDAWGNILSITGARADNLGQLNPLRYRGYVYDTETGLYYLQSRYYDPNIGRFINSDSLVSTGQGILGNNMFAYCLNNPVNSFDNDGHDAIWIQEEERGGGYGHSGILVQDSNGNWYFLYWGSLGNSSTLQKIFGTPYEFVFVLIDASGYDMTIENDIIQALANSGNETAEMRSQYVTGVYYLEGDYSQTYIHLNEMKQKDENLPGSLGKYALLTRNCAQITWNALAKSNIRMATNACPFIPNDAFVQLQFINDMNEYTYFAYSYQSDYLFAAK